jgi:hypothetical protein
MREILYFLSAKCTYRGLGKNLVAIRRCLALDSPHGSVVTGDGGRKEQDLVGLFRLSRNLKLDLRISRMFGYL